MTENKKTATVPFTVRMKKADAELLEDLMDYIEETDDYRVSRSMFANELIRRAMWQIIIDAKKYREEFFKKMGHNYELTYESFLKEILGDKYDKRYLIHAPICVKEDGERAEVDDMSALLFIPLNKEHPLMKESKAKDEEWLKEKFEKFAEMKKKQDK